MFVLAIKLKKGIVGPDNNRNYSQEVFSKRLHVIQDVLIKAQPDETTEATMEQAVTRMSGEFSSLPKYRYESKL